MIVKVNTASVKVMNSYDYCHFEVALSIENATLAEVDEMRKDAQRLVDKAIKQYKIAKRDAALLRYVPPELEQRARAIRENFPASEWTPEQKAVIKELDDRNFRASLYYDYEDDWRDDE